MRKTLILVLSLISLHLSAQIEIEEPKKVEVEAIPFDGSYGTLDILATPEMVAGLIGEKVTIFGISYFDFKYLDGERVDFSERDNFDNKTYEIIDTKKDGYNVELTIKSDSLVYVWGVSSVESRYVFNKYIDKTKEKLLGKTYIPLHLETKTSYRGNSIIFDGNKEYVVTNVKFTKFITEYGFLVEFNNNEELMYSTTQPRVQIKEGEPLVQRKDWINVSGILASLPTETFIEKDSWSKFSSDNSEYLRQIRERKIITGMTEDQVRYSWGMPNSSRRVQISSADMALEYEGPYTLYFKNNKLISIQ